MSFRLEPNAGAGVKFQTEGFISFFMELNAQHRVCCPRSPNMGHGMPEAKNKRGNSASELDRQIEENLRRAYEDTLKEAIPDEMAQLLQKLKSQGEGASK
ncbi:hypothetical protein FHS89_001984 [Rubricella aquisinus]|uniref:Anti-sigma factor NepR domain-containing protein n=1 Tax=Rubricella aquisinus TaxID=2028108 RepID=A0A840WZS3_9RHOB|nr:NepR family anti-sigma factor [Rubricella aquisinus]MBB5515964.1 hypothetical protein [Rubricella aquisinus]